MFQQLMMPQEISMDGFEVVSGTMFMHCAKTSEPSCTIWPTSISFSKSAVMALNACEYVVMRVNNNQKTILISPVSSSDKNSIAWTKGQKAITAKKMDCKAFTTQLYSAWNLNSKNVYRSYGHIVMSEKKIMLLFDFSKAEHWESKS